SPRSCSARRSRPRGSTTRPAADPLREFREVACRPEAQLDLGLAALLLARLEHPALDPAPGLARLDDLAARSGVDEAPGRREKLERLSRSEEHTSELQSLAYLV